MPNSLVLLKVAVGSSQSQNSTISSIDCSSIDSGIDLINSSISKKINLSHCKAIILSEEIAYEGISEYIFTLVNNLEIRPDCNIIISRCSASDYLENSEPTLESISARYYELILNSSEYTGYTENITLADFYSDLLSSTTQAHAILGGINSPATQTSTNDIPAYDIEGAYKADETPLKNNSLVENMGIAVFNDDKLVGELDGTEAFCHLLVVGKVESAIVAVPNPFNSDSVISLFITATKNPKTSVKLINGTPFVECNVTITGNILSLDENLDYTNQNNLKLIENYTNSYLEQNILSYFYKTSKEFKCDIANIGKHAIKNYLVWEDWIQSDWLYNYQNSFFTIKVDTTIQSGQLFTKI
ncbi:MAG: Ger(x)C family spore germination C-terminal domain-containing protein [Clostridia bacterium]|nr:Ger(x)C family spore germination C-terminal domain-containing protein [Clostridia bacterium]